jgi:hypothetical protein
LEIDTEHAKLLLRGVVHECDKFMRIFHEKVPETDQFLKLKQELKQLPGLFYTIYGNGLYYLSLLDTDDQIGFLKYGLEMIENGLELEASQKGQFAKCRILIQLAAVSNEKDYFNLFEKSMEYEFADLDLFLELVQHAYRFADELTQEKEPFMLKAVSIWQRSLKSLLLLM